MILRIGLVAVLATATMDPSALASAGDGADISRLEWLAGCWRGDGGEECWMEPLDGTMLGMNRGPAREGRKPAFEFLRIVEEEGALVYLASPSGRHPPTPFRSVEIGNETIVFANPEHDFPQRITYWLDRTAGETLLRARVEAQNEDFEWQGFELSWRRSSDGE